MTEQKAVHITRVDQLSDIDIEKLATQAAKESGHKIVETWTPGKGSPVQQLDKALDRMQFVATKKRVHTLEQK